MMSTFGRRVHEPSESMRAVLMREHTSHGEKCKAQADQNTRITNETRRRAEERAQQS